MARVGNAKRRNAMDPEGTCVTRDFAKCWRWRCKTTLAQHERKAWKNQAHRRRRAVAHNLHHLDDERHEIVARPVTGWDVI